MKRISFFTNNQNGFVLPYVLLIISIVLLILASTVNGYSQELRITQKHLEQLKIESLLQMGRATFKEEISELKTSEGTITYVFPSGTVKISYLPLSDTRYHLYFFITTLDQSTFSVINTLFIENTIHNL